MLTREVMGSLALAILWVNALLVAAAAAKQIAALLARSAALAGAVPGRVVKGDGPGGELAVHRIEQVGRAAAVAETILFHDRRTAGEVFGGVVALDGGGERVVPACAPGSAEVWLAPDEIERAAACPSAEEFDRACPCASKARGFDRTVSGTLGPGDRVFVTQPVSTSGEGVLVASMDPRALLATKASIGAAFIASELLAAAGCTALALHPPLFGTVSTLGGASSLAFFMLVQPAGTAVRDAMLVPSRAPVRGRWVKPRSSCPVRPVTEAFARPRENAGRRRRHE